MEKGLFSIIIPTFNRANLLKQAISSVLEQSYKKYEIIVVDDGSVDETQKLLRSYGNRIRSFKQPNNGVSAARNLGVEEARGEFIAFLDDDDLYYPEKLKTNFEYFNKHPEAVMLCSGFCFIDEQGDKALRGEVIPDEDILSLRNIAMFDLIHTSSVVVRSEYMKKTGGFPEGQKISEDYYMWSEILKLGNGYSIPEVLTCFRQHQNNTKLSSWLLYKENIKIIKNIFKTKENFPEDIDFYINNVEKIILDNLSFRKKSMKKLYFQIMLKIANCFYL